MKRFKQQINGQLNNKRTGAAWASQYNLKFINLKGFDTVDFYEKILINQEDFLNRAALCDIERPQIQSRREANRLKKKFGV